MATQTNGLGGETEAKEEHGAGVNTNAINEPAPNVQGHSTGNGRGSWNESDPGRPQFAKA